MPGAAAPTRRCRNLLSVGAYALRLLLGPRTRGRTDITAAVPPVETTGGQDGRRRRPTLRVRQVERSSDHDTAELVERSRFRSDELEAVPGRRCDVARGDLVDVVGHVLRA